MQTETVQNKPGAPSVNATATGADEDYDPRSNRAKIQESLARTDRVRARLSGPPPRTRDPRGSPIAVVFDEWREFITAAKANGWTNKQIAAALRSDGVVFKANSMYQRLAKMFPDGARRPRKSTAHKEIKK